MPATSTLGRAIFFMTSFSWGCTFLALGRVETLSWRWSFLDWRSSMTSRPPSAFDEFFYLIALCCHIKTTKNVAKIRFILKCRSIINACIMKIIMLTITTRTKLVWYWSINYFTRTDVIETRKNLFNLTVVSRREYVESVWSYSIKKLKRSRDTSM